MCTCNSLALPVWLLCVQVLYGYAAFCASLILFQLPCLWRVLVLILFPITQGAVLYPPWKPPPLGFMDLGQLLHGREGGIGNL